MAVLKLTYEFPPLHIRAKTDTEGLIVSLRSFLNNLRTLHIRIGVVVNNNADVIIPEEGSGAPSSTPTHKGMHYIDTDINKIYYSVGTSSSSDWIALN